MAREGGRAEEGPPRHGGCALGLRRRQDAAGGVEFGVLKRPGRWVLGVVGMLWVVGAARCGGVGGLLRML